MWRRLLPREHGVWFMWLVPATAGAWWASWRAEHAVVFLAALALHVASYGILEQVRWGGRYREPAGPWAAAGAVGIAAGVYLAARHPSIAVLGVLAAAAFSVNVAFARLRRERLLVNDLLAIGGLSLWGPVAWVVGAGSLTAEAAWLWGLCTGFFLGAALHVKSLFREYGRPAWRWASRAYHMALMPLAWAASGPDTAAAYLPAVVRAWLVPPEVRRRPLVAGLVEITTSLLFLLLLGLAGPVGSTPGQ